jgi:beta-hydroxylase
VTTRLLRDMPSVKAAMYAELPHGALLKSHRDPYAGSLRFHLGLATPNDDRCFIEVDGQRYSWRDGEAVVFDETFIHWAQNDSGATRLILFCDIERPMRYRWAQAVNRWIARNVVAAGSSPNEEGDKTGFINRIFIVSHLMGKYRRRFKQWNVRVYKLTKAALILGLVAGMAAWLAFG